MNGFLIYVAKRFAQFVFVVFTGVTLAFLEQGLGIDQVNEGPRPPANHRRADVG